MDESKDPTYTEDYNEEHWFNYNPVTDSEVDLEPPGPPPVIIIRKAWGAREDCIGVQRTFTFPVENVIYSYTETDVCTTYAECVKTMKEMQMNHIAEGHPDIKFNFVIGGDGRVYEGTGWFVRAPKNEQFPELEGDHIEFSHTGRRGKDKVPAKHRLRGGKKWMNGLCYWNRNRAYVLDDFPLKEQVKLVNRLYDHGLEGGYVTNDARVCLDYVGPTSYKEFQKTL